MRRAVFVALLALVCCCSATAEDPTPANIGLPHVDLDATTDLPDGAAAEAGPDAGPDGEGISARG